MHAPERGGGGSEVKSAVTGWGPGALPASLAGARLPACQGARSSPCRDPVPVRKLLGSLPIGRFCSNPRFERAAFGTLTSTAPWATLEEEEFLICSEENLLIVYLPSPHAG